MTQEIVTVNPRDLAPKTWTEAQYNLVRAICAKDATDEEFALMLNIATSYGLDPLMRQIWCVKYPRRDGGANPASIFVGYHGFVQMAHRSGNFDGYLPELLYDDAGALIGARCSVWSKAMSRPVVEEAYLVDYSTGKGNWNTMQGVMIEKCAAVRAFRLAFPTIPRGVYIAEEMDQAGYDAATYIETSSRTIESAGSEAALPSPSAKPPAFDAVAARSAVEKLWVAERKFGATPPESEAKVDFAQAGREVALALYNRVKTRVDILTIQDRVFRNKDTDLSAKVFAQRYLQTEDDAVLAELLRRLQRGEVFTPQTPYPGQTVVVPVGDEGGLNELGL